MEGGGVLFFGFFYFLSHSHLVVFSECFNIFPRHLCSHHHSALDDAPTCYDIIWGFPSNYKTMEDFRSLNTFLEP